MKTKIGELYNKPIVIGNPNEFTKNEIPLSELKGGSEDSFDDGMRYFLIVTRIENYSPEFPGLRFTSSVIRDGNLEFGEGQYYDEIQAFAINAYMNVPYSTNKTYSLIENEIYTVLHQKLSDINYFKPITAKEYYSLLD